MMETQHPEFLAAWPWLLALLVLRVLLLVQQWWWQRRQFGAALLKRYGPALSLWRGLLKLALWGAGAWYLLQALAVPLGPPVKVDEQQSGADIILAVDVSSSMYAQDIAPNRLTALKTALTAFTERVQGDRVGLVAFAGEAVVACPLTSDMETLGLFISKLETDSVPRDGTGLGPALKLCLDAFAPDPQRGRLVVLATDGEDTAGSQVMEQAQRAAAQGVPVFTLGIGTPGGALVPGRPDVFGRVYAKTYQGQPVRTKLDSATLKRIADVTGARYFEGASSAGLNAAYDRVRSLKQGLGKGQERYVREPLYQKPLLWAFWLLLLEALLSLKAHGWSKLLQGGRRKVGLAGLLLLLLPGAAQAGLDQGRHAYNQGNAAYRQGDMQGAAQAFEQATQDGPDRYENFYNLGNAKYQQGDYQGAVSAYESAQALAPDDDDVIHNLDLARRRLEQQSKQDKGKDGKKDGKEQGQKKGPGQSQGQGQGKGDGKGPGQPQPGTGGKPSPEQARREAASAGLNQDQVQAMMNQLKLDQKRYQGNFNPMKKYEKPQTPQEQQEEMLRQMGFPVPPRPKQDDGGNGPERKDW
jgi:Ca-activated chloride channel family protein